ncbi:MAG: leucine--tRNA ligase, partial [Candidatus Altiarchaeota archaeon]|nr:leucine--tRNA ligase [Candidatus Altiarchaeota archaeon]
NPDVNYLKVNVDGQIWLLSREAFEKLKFIKDGLKEEGELMGSELIGKTCTNPLDNKEVPILEASFVKPGYATGVVMSVPAHAPYDYIALKDLNSDIESIVIIDGEKYKGTPAEEVILEMGIKSQEDPKLEEATEVLYREEHSKGRMAKGIADYGGMPVRDAREKVTEELVNSGRGDIFYEFSEQPVTCRCGSQCFVKILKDQWFVRYSDDEWKKSTHKCLDNMDIIPQETRDNFSYFIDWLNDWACTRRVGLGTKLPWDDKWIIEPLSDSTIYMAYYTISKHLREIEPKKLTPEVFDYILLGKGKAEEISSRTGIDNLKKIRDEFLYWYPPEWRLSAKDLVGNHLTFHIFHHTALFPEEIWPKGIVIFGMGLMDGEKMSSSKGNTILLKDAIDEYGSDTIRLFLMSNAEPWQDFDWRENLLKNTARKLKQFYELVEHANGLKDESPMRDIDRWILSRVNEAISDTRKYLDGFQMRKALQTGFFGILNDLAWYLRRCEPNANVMKEIADLWVRLMTPFTPFICEELWERMGNDLFVSKALYPDVNKELINDEVIVKEDMVIKLREDIQNILEATKTKPKIIYLYPAPDWKRKLFVEIKAGKKMNELMQNPELKPHGKEISSLMNRIRPDDIPSLTLTLDEETNYLSHSVDFLGKEFNCDIEIQPKAEHDPQGKAKVALPMKPGIYFE